jgi:hypothetical protein
MEKKYHTVKIVPKSMKKNIPHHQNSSQINEKENTTPSK